MSQDRTLVDKYLPGLEIFQRESAFMPALVSLKALEAELAKGIMVYGLISDDKKNPNALGVLKYKGDRDTHQGLLIGYQPIEKEKPVSKEEVVTELLSLCKSAGIDYDETHELIERIKKVGFTND